MVAFDNSQKRITNFIKVSCIRNDSLSEQELKMKIKVSKDKRNIWQTRGGPWHKASSSLSQWSGRDVARMPGMWKVSLTRSLESWCVEVWRNNILHLWLLLPQPPPSSHCHHAAQAPLTANATLGIDYMVSMTQIRHSSRQDIPVPKKSILRSSQDLSLS